MFYSKKMQKSTLTERVVLYRTPSCISDLTLRTPNQERDINYPAKEQDEREIMIDVSNSRRWHLWNLAFMPLIGICAQWWVIWNHALNIQTVDYIVMSAGCISFANGIALLHLPFTNYLPICTLGKRLNSYSTQWGGKSRLID